MGFVTGVVHDTPPVPLFVPGRIGVVDSLSVAARARRRGVGCALIAEAEAWLRERGTRDIELTVHEAAHAAIAGRVELDAGRAELDARIEPMGHDRERPGRVERPGRAERPARRRPGQAGRPARVQDAAVPGGRSSWTPSSGRVSRTELTDPGGDSQPDRLRAAKRIVTGGGQADRRRS